MGSGVPQLRGFAPFEPTFSRKVVGKHLAHEPRGSRGDTDRGICIGRWHSSSTGSRHELAPVVVALAGRILCKSSEVVSLATLQIEQRRTYIFGCTSRSDIHLCRFEVQVRIIIPFEPDRS